jgi:hypothetical protein
MRRSSSREGLLWAALVAPLAAAALPAVAVAAEDALALARVSLVERKVEFAKKGSTWQAAVEGGPLRIGEALRTGPDAVARLELPWMAVTLGPGSTVSFPDDFLLSASLDGGRALVEAQGRDALKIVTAEAEVRGQGRAVVRRQGQETLVTCLAGKFHVHGRDSAVTLSAGRGTVVRAGAAPSAPQAVPAPPGAGMWPGRDPVFATSGQSLELRWKGDAPAYQIELLPVGSDVVLLQRDVEAPPARIELPWEGAFRWRVSARDKRGLEGTPSEDGLIAVDAK